MPSTRRDFPSTLRNVSPPKSVPPYSATSIEKKTTKNSQSEVEENPLPPQIPEKEYKLGERNIVKGDIGPDVNELAKLLIKNKLLHPNFSSQQKCNSQIVQALKNAQIIANRSVNGILDSQLLQILLDWTNKKKEYIAYWKEVEIPLSGSVDLYETKPAVRVAGILLSLYGFMEPYYLIHINKTDTLYDSRLSDAVKRFQERQNMPQTKKLNEITYQKIQQFPIP